MAAHKGNEYAKGCETSGRPRTIVSPDDLWELFVEYKESIFNSPYVKKEVTQRANGAELKQIYIDKPLTWDGFELFIDIHSLRDYKKKYKEFSHIITRIDKEIYNNKFSGAASGLFNSNIIARDLGLKDRSENDIKVTHELTPEERAQRIEQLKQKLNAK